MLFRRLRDRLVQEPEAGSMNLTPMIDMTFLLVVFFMLTIDLSTKEFFPVDLPFASEGIPDEEVDGVPRRLVVNLDSAGTIHFKNHAFELASADPGTQDDALLAFRDALRSVHGADPVLRDPTGASNVPVLIHADREAKWKYVQWLMGACATNKIYQLQFAVKKPSDPEGR